MRCQNCGAEVNGNARFCRNCGAHIEPQDNMYSNEYNNNYNSGHNSNYNGGYNNERNTYNSGNYKKGNNYNRRSNGTNPLMIVVIVLLGIILFMAAVLVSNTIMSGNNPFAKPTPSPEPTPTPTPIVTEAPVVTPQVIYVQTEEHRDPPEPRVEYIPEHHDGAENVVMYPSYSTYNSSTFRFKCNYPAHYITYNDGLNTSLYTVRSADGNAIQKICAKVNEGETVQGQLQNYIDTHRGYVDYKTSGSDYFAVSVINGTMHSYKYCKFKNGNLYWFEFEYNTAIYADVYDSYINDIYRSFSIY